MVSTIHKKSSLASLPPALPRTRIRSLYVRWMVVSVQLGAVTKVAGEETTSRVPIAISMPGGLTAEEVARRAEATAPEIKARGKALAAAEASLAQALSAFVPRLTLTARYARLSSYNRPALQTLPSGALDPITTDPRVAASPPTLALAEGIVQAYERAASVGSRFPMILNQFLTQAALVVPVSDYALRLAWQYGAASHSVKAASLLQKAAKATTRADARILYYTWLRARAQVLVAERALIQAQQHLSDAERHLQAGLIPKADVSRVRAQVASAELALRSARNVAELRQEQIKSVMHDRGSGNYVPGEELAATPKSFQLGGTISRLQEEAFTQRLEIKALNETARSFVEQSKAHRAEGWPQLSVFGSVTSARPNPRIVPATDEFRTTWELGAQIVWVPSDVMTANAQASGALAKAEETEQQRSALRDRVALEVFESYQQMTEAGVAVETSATEVQAAEEAYWLRRDLFHSGDATSSELTDAELDWVRAQMDAINSQTDLIISRVRLEHALGREVK